jgi:hypothetical protein
VGGTKEISAFGLKNVEIIFSGKVGNFKSVDLLTEKTTEDSKYFYGNIGQDLIQQFNSYTINFNSFCITFN